MATGGVDGFQRRHPVLGVPIAVIYKFFEDQGNFLAAMATYYAFIAIFPLLLLASSIFGFVLQGRPDLEEAALNSALAQFPIIGDQLGRPEGLTGSVTAVVVGSLAAIYGALGLGQAIQNVMNAAWSVPRNSRPNPVLMRLRSLLLLLLAGTAVLGLSIFSALGSNAEVFGPAGNAAVAWLIRIGTVLILTAVLTSLFRLAAARSHSWVGALPGAFFTAVGWQVLQNVGAMYATSVLAGTSALNQTFGLVLGLIGLIFIASLTAVLGIEINVVLARRLWPRALLTPFTDAVDLTDADRKAYALYAQAQRHKGFETVTVRFDGRDGDTHEIEQVSRDRTR
ncbi:YihY/virulence factor BrkB family protein [Nocardioides euryhalodurans]|uniref:YihY/virulence factor BrkB family protein n=1 Tax=Nocardioides euryhalodurans TaxID=2518370 RepID=A0A4P7GMC5_9ACTN|nr:YihY/virulence factor BrkB family protein [Nocardioides euryhalodurans]QBR93059.1 YihY/virulence factor BrkB family protein [Nocardioides euryhalodurans]